MKACSGRIEKTLIGCSFLQVFFGTTRNLKYFRPQIQQALHKSQKPCIILAAKTKVTAFKVEKMSRN